MIRLTSHCNAQLRVKPAEDGQQSRTIEGYAIMFDSESEPLWRDETGNLCHEVISRSAVTEDLISSSDIKMTMYHDDGRLLARSNKGKGTLSVSIDERGAHFSFDAPKTQWGDEALELVGRGDVDGCSFAFTTAYDDPEWVSRSEAHDGKRVFTVNRIGGIFDFTLTPDPAYPQTECSLRSQHGIEKAPEASAKADNSQQIAEMEAELAKTI